MKNQFGAIILLLICLVCAGLGVALVTSKKQAADQKAADSLRIIELSNQWVTTESKFEEQKTVAAEFEKDLTFQKKIFGDLTNQYSQVAASLTKAEEQVRTTEEEVRKREAQIGELEAKNSALDKQSIELSTSITNLNLQIASTEKKLAASEGDKEYLEKELKRLMAEKSDLEKKFNDLAFLRAQVARVKEELAISRRLEWIRQGLFANSDAKGAQKLMQGFGSVASVKTTPRPNYDLNVEVGSDGKVQVIPPLTNSAAPPK